MGRSTWLAMILGLGAATALAASPTLRTAVVERLRAVGEPLFERGAATEPRFDAFYAGMVESLPPQEKVERALELAINNRDGAAEYVMREAQGWRGAFKPSDKLRTLVQIAGDAPRIEVRMAGFEVQLAEYGFEKNAAAVDALEQHLRDDPQNNAAWSLWNMALLGARGVARERVFRELVFATQAGEEAQRRWAIDALAKFGGAEIVDPLLDIAEREPSALLRERAFCALAQSGTLLVAERYQAVPRLFAIAADAKADRQSIAWAYQAMREITSTYDLPDESRLWRERLERAGLL